MVILVVFNSFSVVKNLKKPDLVARQKLPFYTTGDDSAISYLFDYPIFKAMYMLIAIYFRKHPALDAD